MKLIGTTWDDLAYLYVLSKFLPLIISNQIVIISHDGMS